MLGFPLGTTLTCRLCTGVQMLDIAPTDAALDRVLSRPLSALGGGPQRLCCFTCQSAHQSGTQCPRAGASDERATRLEAGPADAGDGALAVVRPFMNALFAPSDESERAQRAEAAVRPEIEVQVAWVHALRGWDLLRSMHALASGEVAYVAAGLVVLHDFKGEGQAPTQRHFTGHNADVTALAVHPDLRVLASGESGDLAMVLVWDTTTLKVVAKLCGYQHHGRWVADPVGVRCIAFGGDGGEWAATVGCGTRNRVTLYDWKGATMLANVELRADERVLAAAFSPADATLVTAGVNHLTFWTFMKGRLHAREAVYGEKGQPCTMESVEFVSSGELQICLTGTIDGRVCIWSTKGALLNITTQGHARGISNIVFHPRTGKFATGGRDGAVWIWRLDGIRCMAERETGPFWIDASARESFWEARRARAAAGHAAGGDAEEGAGVRVVEEAAVHSLVWRGAEMLVATGGSEIARLQLDRECTALARQEMLHPTHGHGAVVGAEIHPLDDKVFVTAGEDYTIRVWDSRTHAALATARVPRPDPGSRPERVPEDAWVLEGAPSALHLSVDGEVAAVGCRNGGILLFAVDPKARELPPHAVGSAEAVQCRSLRRGAAVTCVKFGERVDPDGSREVLLAAGCADGAVDLYVLRPGGLAALGTCKGHAGSVLQLAWDLEAEALASASSEEELLFWDVARDAAGRAACRQRRPLDCRDIAWRDWTLPFGYAVRGAAAAVGEAGREASLVLSFEDRVGGREPVLASGDARGRISLLPYPCGDGAAALASARAIPGAVRAVRLSQGHDYILCCAVGGGSLVQLSARPLSRASAPRVEAEAARRDPCVQSLLDVLAKAPAAAPATEVLVAAPPIQRSGVRPLPAFPPPPRTEPAGAEDDGKAFVASFHPYTAAIRAPHGWEPDARASEPPRNSLRLEFAHGYQGERAKGNIRRLATGDALYPLANLCVIMNLAQRTQRHFAHPAAVSCVDVHSNGMTVASADASEPHPPPPYC